MQPLSLLLLANERPLINIDITLLFNVGLWFVLFFFLRGTLWKSMIDLLEAREHGLEGSRVEARKLVADAHKARDQFDAALQDARRTASVERDRLRAEGVRREAELLAKVQAEVGASIEKQRAEVGAQREKLRQEVLSEVPALAQGLAAKILRREVQS